MTTQHQVLLGKEWDSHKKHARNIVMLLFVALFMALTFAHPATPSDTMPESHRIRAATH